MDKGRRQWSPDTVLSEGQPFGKRGVRALFFISEGLEFLFYWKRHNLKVHTASLAFKCVLFWSINISHHTSACAQCNETMDATDIADKSSLHKVLGKTSCTKLEKEFECLGKKYSFGVRVGSLSSFGGGLVKYLQLGPSLVLMEGATNQQSLHFCLLTSKAEEGPSCAAPSPTK